MVYRVEIQSYLHLTTEVNERSKVMHGKLSFWPENALKTAEHTRLTPHVKVESISIRSRTTVTNSLTVSNFIWCPLIRWIQNSLYLVLSCLFCFREKNYSIKSCTLTSWYMFSIALQKWNLTRIGLSHLQLHYQTMWTQANQLHCWSTIGLLCNFRHAEG